MIAGYFNIWQLLMLREAQFVASLPVIKQNAHSINSQTGKRGLNIINEGFLIPYVRINIFLRMRLNIIKGKKYAKSCEVWNDEEKA